jgi:hypothetical protein
MTSIVMNISQTAVLDFIRLILSEVQNLLHAPPRGGGNFSFLGKFFIFGEIFGALMREPLDLLLF